jgi:hypothetical protein
MDEGKIWTNHLVNDKTELLELRFIDFIDKLRIHRGISFDGLQTTVNYPHHLTLKDTITAHRKIIEIFLHIPLNLTIQLEVVLV